MSHPDASRRADRSLGLALVAIGVAACGSGLAIGGWAEGAWGPRTVPLLAAATLVASGAAVVLAAPFAGLASPVKHTTQDGAPRSEAAVAWLLGLAVLYLLAIDRIGYLAATLLMAPATFWLFGVRRPATLLVAALVVPLALHIVFFRILGVFPPLGAWFDLLDHVPL